MHEDHDVSREDVDAYVRTLRTMGTPWSNGCADLILKLASSVVSYDGRAEERDYTVVPAGMPIRAQSRPSAATVGPSKAAPAPEDEKPGERLATSKIIDAYDTLLAAGVLKEESK